jgi:uncharacterized metal-binding protein YceD (DUF177 family)
MSKNEDYIIQISKLKKGSNIFEYEIDKGLFEGTDVEDVKCHLTINAKKSERMVEVDFSYNGKLKVLCSRCLENMEIDVQTTDFLYVKFGDKYEEVDINEVIIPESENEIDFSQYIYDCLMLQIPISPVHKDKEECDKEMIEKLHFLSQTKQDDSTIDPRWEKLKELKNK